MMGTARPRFSLRSRPQFVMLVLAIETSGPQGSVALMEARTVLADSTLELGRKHAQSLIPTIQKVLAACGRTPRDVELVAVSIGPGSYTGLRVGVVCAKSLVYALNCPLVGVDTLLAIACNAPPETRRVEVVADAQRGDLFVGRYERDAGDRWVRPGEIQVLRADDWASGLTESHTVSGPGLETTRVPADGPCRVLPVHCWTPNASCVARLGLDSLAAEQIADSWKIEPLYLRRSSAEVQWERLHPGK